MSRPSVAAAGLCVPMTWTKFTPGTNNFLSPHSFRIQGNARMTLGSISRREFVVGSAVGAATVVLAAEAVPAADGKKTFTILHTNDLHSNFLGMSPASDDSPFTPNDDKTRGGFARHAAATRIGRWRQRCHRLAAGGHPGDQGVAGDHGFPASFAIRQRRRTARHSRRRPRCGSPGNCGFVRRL